MYIPLSQFPFVRKDSFFLPYHGLFGGRKVTVKLYKDGREITGFYSPTLREILTHDMVWVVEEEGTVTYTSWGRPWNDMEHTYSA